MLAPAQYRVNVCNVSFGRQSGNIPCSSSSSRGWTTLGASFRAITPTYNIRLVVFSFHSAQDTLVALYQQGYTHPAELKDPLLHSAATYTQRRGRMRLAIIIFLIACSVLPAAAQGRSTSVEGKQWCGTWLRERHARSERLQKYEIWVVRFIVGHDWADIPRPGFFSKVDAAGMLGWVDNYCRAHPLNNVQRAAERLVIELTVRTMMPRFAAVSPTTSTMSIKSAET